MKEIIGYNVKQGVVRNAALKAIGCPGNIANPYELGYSSFYANEARKLGVLDLLFEPVYEEEKKIIKVAHKDGVLDVEIKDGKAWGEGIDYDKYQLTESIKSQGHYRHPILPTHFDIGCKKNISREDIQKVIDALN